MIWTMLSLWAFWLVLMLPGVAIAGRFAPRDLCSGSLGTIAISTFWSFALLSPVAIVGYLLHLPVAFISAAVGVAVVAGVWELTRQRSWRLLGRCMLAGLGLESLVLAADLVAGGSLGSFIGGDAMFHIARVRMLLEHGLNNWGPHHAPALFQPCLSH